MLLAVRESLRLLVPAALAAVTLAFSLTLLVARLWPQSTAARLAAAYLPIAEVHAALADRAVTIAGRADPHFSQAQLKLASAESLAELRIAPMRARPWLRLAFIDVQSHDGALSDAGLIDVQNSYDFAPFDRDDGPWRLAFVYDHWDELNPRVRDAALAETQVLWRGSSEIQALAQTLPNPAGRLAATMALDNLKAGAEP